MSTRYNNGSHYENHQRAAELHDAAAHAHRAAMQHGQSDHLSGHELSRRAHEYSEEAHRHTEAFLLRHGVGTAGDDETAALAYQNWLRNGRPEGSETEDWFHAVREMESRSSK